MHSARKAILILAVVALVAGLAVYSFLGQGALAADRTPGRLETAVARRLVRLSIPAAARRASNPASPGGWRRGSDGFAAQCTVCHGANGRGQSEIGRNMYPPVPDLASADIQHFSDGELFSIIQNGVSWTGMPAFRSSQSDADTWRLVSFIRRIPSLSDEDRVTGEAPAALRETPAAVIAMEATQFQPTDVTVRLGDIVEWVNRDPFPHNVASAAGGFHSTAMEPDQSWHYRTTTRGTFKYICTLHPTMVAALHVQ
jgi:plastocyanin